MKKKPSRGAGGQRGSKLFIWLKEQPY